MDWLNIHSSTLDSAEMVGSEPVDRATWLCLQRFCIGQENAGRIANCRSWADRKWQQLARVTLKEVSRPCDLWAWDGADLIVWRYPVDKEAEVISRRGVAKLNGSKGGRPKKTDVGLPEETHAKPTLVISGKAEEEGERKGKGKEGERERESAREAEEIVSAYPRRENTQQALEIVLKHLQDGEDAAAVLAGTKACAEVIKALPSGAGNRYVPGAMKFFLGKRWKDDPQTLRRQDDTGSAGKRFSGIQEDEIKIPVDEP